MVYTVWEVENLTAFLKNISVWNEKKKKHFNFETWNIMF